MDTPVGRQGLDPLAVEADRAAEPMTVLSVVVLPAPFDPIRVTISPRLTASETPLSARMFP
jgi:hypothetical protein